MYEEVYEEINKEAETSAESVESSEEPIVEETPEAPEPVVEKKVFVPREGTKKAQAWGLFTEGKKASEVKELVGVTDSTARTWYAVFKRNNK